MNNLLYSNLEPVSNSNIYRNNEINLATGYKMDNGNAYLNHRGCNLPIEVLFIERGMGDHTLTTIKVKDVLIGNTSLKSKLGI